MGLNKKLKMGLGIGCGLLLTVFLLVVGGGTYWATNTGREFKAVIKVEKELNTAYGVLGDYYPPEYGLPARERVAVFIQVRQDMVEYRNGMETALQEYLTGNDEPSANGFMEFVNTVRSGSRLAPAYARFWQARNEKLLEHDMGAGEYVYIYCLSYYGFRGLDPADGVTDLNPMEPTYSGVNVSVGTSDPDNDLTTAEKARRRTAEFMLTFLERVEFLAGQDLTPELVAWRQQVQAEIIHLQNDPFGIPFQSAGSEALATLFGEFAYDLDQTYTPLVNPLELFFQQEVEEVVEQ